MEVLDNILSLLKIQKRKQSELAAHLNLSKNVFTNWKRGDNSSYKKYLPEIAEFLGVSVDYLVGNETKTETPSFTYALYNEMTHDLSQEQIDQLKKFADFLRNS